MRFLPSLFVLPVFLAACTTIPSAQVAGVKLEKQGPEGARVVAELHFENATATPMPMVAVSYRLEVEGAAPFEIDDQPFMTVPTRFKPDPAQDVWQNGEQTVLLPAGMATAQSLAGKKFVLDGEFTFEPDTDWRRLKTEVGVPLPTRSFHAEGVLGQAAPNPPAPPAPSPKP